MCGPPTRRKRIALYCHSIAPSVDGVCRRFSGILRELVKDHQVVLFTLETEPEDIPHDELLDIITIDHISLWYYPGKKISVPSMRSWIRILRALWKHKPDIVHVTADGLSQFFAMAGYFTGVATVGSFHTDLVDLLTVLKASAFQLWCVKTKESVDNYALDSCATTSVSFKEKLLTQGLDCEHVIITAVDGDTFAPGKKDAAMRNELTFGNPDGYLCVYAGRVSQEKRLELVIEAVQSMDNVYLAIVGDGPAASHYATMHSKEKRIYCKPRFLDHSELAKVYASSDVHVSASIFETLGNTVLEAFSCGIPVVVPRTQGFVNTVTHNETGLFFEPGNVDDCRKQLEKLRADPKLRARMGKKARAAMKERTTTRVVEDLLAWYSRALDTRHKRSWIKHILIFLYLSLTVPFTTFVYNATYVATAVMLFFGFQGPFIFPDLNSNDPKGFGEETKKLK